MITFSWIKILLAEIIYVESSGSLSSTWRILPGRYINFVRSTPERVVIGDKDLPASLNDSCKKIKVFQQQRQKGLMTKIT